MGINIVNRIAKLCIVCTQFQCSLFITTWWIQQTSSSCVYFSSLLFLRLLSAAYQCYECSGDLRYHSNIANFIFTCVSTWGVTRNLQCIPVTCLHGPCFLVVWNIHILCNLSCAMRGIVRNGVTMCVTATQ